MQLVVAPPESRYAPSTGARSLSQYLSGGFAKLRCILIGELTGDSFEELSKPNSRCLFWLALSCSSFLRSNILKPARYIESESNKVLMYLSRGELLDNEGDTFTSSSQGRKSESIKMSKP